jgi:hypothetical protein
MIIPGARFVHGKRSALEHLLVEAAHRFLGLGPFAELNKRKPARFSGVAIHRQINGQGSADCGEVLTQLSLSHVKSEVSNKEAHRHYDSRNNSPRFHRRHR